MTEKLTKPSLFNTLAGGVITTVRDSFHFSRPSVPKQLGKYTLVTDIEKERGYNYSFSLGIYTYNRKKYFIKHWQGKVKDLTYYSLINEYRLGTLLSRKIKKLQPKSISTPEIIEYFQTPHSFSIVYEYINGKSLTVYPKKKQLKVLLHAIETLEDISQSLTKKEQSQFSRRSLIFYFFSFFPLFLLVLLMNTKQAKTLTQVFIKTLLMLPSLKNSQFGITHRDLDATNIVMKRGKAYITDLETMVLTLASYDTVRLTLMTDIKRFPTDFTKLVKRKENIFLRIYILFHLTLSANAIPHLKSQYIKELTMYA